MNNGFLAWGNYLCPKWDFTFYLCAFSKKCEDWDANLYFFVSILWWPRKALLRPLTSNRLIEWWSQLLNSEIPHCICMSSIFSWAAPSQWLNISRILKFTHSWEMQNSSEWWLWHKDSLLVLLRFTCDVRLFIPKLPSFSLSSTIRLVLLSDSSWSSSVSPHIHVFFLQVFSPVNPSWHFLLLGGPRLTSTCFLVHWHLPR